MLRLGPVLLSLALITAPALADTLDMPAPHAAAPDQASDDRPGYEMDLPSRGMSMSEVQKRFGAPLVKRAAVGEPPIARWVYQSYTVYFEGKYVLHAVLHHDR